MKLYALDIDRLRPGDILLTRVDFHLANKGTWMSKFIQLTTQSHFSHAALCIDYGMFLEAIGTGVCRLAVMATAAHKRENIRLIRPKDPRASEAAAKIGERFLSRGYSRSGAAGARLKWMQDPQRAELFCSQLVAQAYEDAEYELVPGKTSRDIAPADLERATELEDVTDQVIFELTTDDPPDYFLDDHSHFERPHHWEVQTKLEILASDDVQKLLRRHGRNPASFWELEGVLAKLKARALDAAIHSQLVEHRFAEEFLERTRRIVDFNPLDMSLPAPEKINAAEMDERTRSARIRQTLQILKQLEIDVEHRQRECDLYDEYERRTRLATFGYLGSLQQQLLKLARNGLRAKEEELRLLELPAN